MKHIQLENKIARSEGFITSTVDDEVMMMSIEKGHYYGLDDIGSHIWQQLENPVRVADLCAQLSTEFNVDQDQCETDVLAFLNELADEGMISIVTESSA